MKRWFVLAAALLILHIIPLSFAADSDFVVLKRRADRGDAMAQFTLGNMYSLGSQEAPQSYPEALRWYRKAADLGFAPAQYTLGTLYDEGKVVRQDFAEALKWYEKAAEQGFAPAQNSLGANYESGKGSRRDYVKAYMWFDLAGRQGVEEASQSRDLLTGKMTPGQIAEAQRLAQAWQPAPKGRPSEH